MVLVHFFSLFPKGTDTISLSWVDFNHSSKSLVSRIRTESKNF